MCICKTYWMLTNQLQGFLQVHVFQVHKIPITQRGGHQYLKISFTLVCKVSGSVPNSMYGSNFVYAKVTCLAAIMLFSYGDGGSFLFWKLVEKWLGRKITSGKTCIVLWLGGLWHAVATLSTRPPYKRQLPLLIMLCCCYQCPVENKTDLSSHLPLVEVWTPLTPNLVALIVCKIVTLLMAHNGRAYSTNHLTVDHL